MPEQRNSLFVRAGLALALVLVLGACTKSGQFDPTELFNSDVFDSKKKLSGQREAVFPNGVPGTTTGVPVDLVKGYQPPPDPTDANASQPPPGASPGAGPPAAGAAPGGPPGAGAPTATAEAKPKPKPKPKPKLASAPAAPPPGGSTRLTIGSRPAAATQDQNTGAQSNWPAPQASSPAQANWPAQPPAPSAQTNWPAPSAAGPAQKTAQPSQSIWPNPPATTQ